MAHLAAIFKKRDKSSNVHVIRELPASEFAGFEKCWADFQRLRERYTLLHILDKNFMQLDSFTQSLEGGKQINAGGVLAELNNHFMNYLSSGYSLRQHLETFIKRDFGRDSVHPAKFQQFLELLEKASFEYVFLQDFRNFVQHCGFPVGSARLTHEERGRTLAVTYSKASLLESYKGWKKCNLQNRPESELDLLAIVGKAHRVTRQEFSGLIYAVYGTNLNRIDSCFVSFQKEAADVNPNAVARIISSMSGDSSDGQLQLQDIPRNAFSELGLSRAKTS
jgi:hypothetical protein